MVALAILFANPFIKSYLSSVSNNQAALRLPQLMRVSEALGPSYSGEDKAPAPTNPGAGLPRSEARSYPRISWGAPINWGARQDFSSKHLFPPDPKGPRIPN